MLSARRRANLQQVPPNRDAGGRRRRDGGGQRRLAAGNEPGVIGNCRSNLVCRVEVVRPESTIGGAGPSIGIQWGYAAVTDPWLRLLNERRSAPRVDLEAQLRRGKRHSLSSGATRASNCSCVRTWLSKVYTGSFGVNASIVRMQYLAPAAPP